jgi:hypothetical protein
METMTERPEGTAAPAALGSCAMRRHCGVCLLLTLNAQPTCKSSRLMLVLKKPCLLMSFVYLLYLLVTPAGV